MKWYHRFVFKNTEWFYCSIKGQGFYPSASNHNRNIFVLSTIFILTFPGLIPGPKSYLLDFSNVFVTACGTSFYSQCLPSRTVNLGFSSTAMHWLCAKPCDVTGAFHHILVEEQETVEKLKKQAAEDWELLLLQRAKEMAPGG